MHSYTGREYIIYQQKVTRCSQSTARTQHGTVVHKKKQWIVRGNQLIHCSGQPEHYSYYTKNMNEIKVKMCQDNPDGFGVRKVADLLWMWVMDALFRSTSRGLSPEKCPGQRKSGLSGSKSSGHIYQKDISQLWFFVHWQETSVCREWKADGLYHRITILYDP